MFRARYPELNKGFMPLQRWSRMLSFVLSNGMGKQILKTDRP